MQDTHHPASNISSNQVPDNTLTIVIGIRKTCCCLSNCLIVEADDEGPCTGCILGPKVIFGRLGKLVAYEDSPKSAVSSIIASSSSLEEMLPNYKDMCTI